MIKVLIVDDSAFIRSFFTQALGSDPDIEVIGTAKDGEDCLEKLKVLNPDVITLDVEMPRRNGLSTLEEIMKSNPRPVIMVSTLTSEGAEATLKALDLGAADFISKIPQDQKHINLNAIKEDLCEKVKAVSKMRRFMRPRRAAFSSTQANTSASSGLNSRLQDKPTQTADFKVNERFKPVASKSIFYCLAIGVSTGGPPAVQKVLTQLPEDFPAYILIAQHMPATFTGAFANRLDSLCKIKVKEAEDGEIPKRGIAYIAPGGKHMQLAGRSTAPHIAITKEPESAIYKPNANVLFDSVANFLGSKAVGLIMTGMGNDGASGMKLMKAKGSHIIAQEESTCVVYGMPKAVVDAGLADEIIKLDNIATTINKIFHK